MKERNRYGMNRMETERMYAYFLCSIPMIGGVRAGQLQQRLGSPQGIYDDRVTAWRESVIESIAEYKDRHKKAV